MKKLALLLAMLALPVSAWAQGCVGSNGINTIANCPAPTSLLLTDKVATYQNVQTPHTRAATWADISALLGAGGGGAAGGDLSGTFPNPTVAAINGGALGTATPTSANVLIGSGTAWVTHAFSGDWTIGNTGVATLATVNSAPGSVGDGTHVAAITVNAKGLVTAATATAITGAAPTGSAGGDLTGTYPNPTLAAVNSNTGTWGDGTHVGAFTVNGKGLITAASSVAITGAAPTGSAGGDLSGTFPNPTVAKLNGVAAASYALLGTAQTYTAAQRAQPSTLALSTATFTPNFDTAQNFSMVLVHATCVCTIANPSTTPVAGQSGMLAITQSSTGSDTVTWGGLYKFAGATAPTLSTGANAVDFLPYYVFSATQIIVGAGVLNAH